MRLDREKIKLRMQRRGIERMADLADAIGVTQSTLSHWFGRRDAPPAYVDALCRVLACQPDDLRALENFSQPAEEPCKNFTQPDDEACKNFTLPPAESHMLAGLLAIYPDYPDATALLSHLVRAANARPGLFGLRLQNAVGRDGQASLHPLYERRPRHQPTNELSAEARAYIQKVRTAR